MADQQMVQSSPAWDERETEEDQGTPYALRAERNWRKTKYADAGRAKFGSQCLKWTEALVIIHITARVHT